MPEEEQRPDTFTVVRPRSKQMGRLRSYNQFPLHYADIRAMKADLPRIRNMGFTSVWVNPLFEPCQSIEWSEKEITRVLGEGAGEDKKLHSKAGSPYATRSFTINPKISAHASNGLNAEERKKADYEDIRSYTDTARAQGLTPLYDFVMRHVAVDNPLVEQKPHWFKRHANGNFVFFGRDENYRATGQSWDDVLEFNYNDPTVRHEIVTEYLKPMANIIIGQLGFEGFRIDAAGKMPRELYAEIIPYVDQLCQLHYRKPALIIGETLGQNIGEFLHTGGYMDHVYNSIYFQPFVKEFWDQDNTWFSDTKGRLQAQVAPTIGFVGNHDVLRLADYYFNKQHIRGDLLRQVIAAGTIDNEIPIQKVLNIFVSLNDKKAFVPGQLKALVEMALMNGVVSVEETTRLHAEIDEKGKLTQQTIKHWFTDHCLATDQPRQILFRALVDTMFKVVRHEREKEVYEMRTFGEQRTKKLISENEFIRLIPGKLDETRLRRLIKEAMSFIAFSSDGGWFLSLGDEWGVKKRTNVFSASPEDIQHRAYPGMDFSKFITSINAVIAQLPPPTNPEWVQRCYLENGSDKTLASFLIHQGEGFGGTCHLVIANVTDTKQVVDYNTFMEIKSANGRNHCQEKNGIPSHIYLCGDVELSPHLRTALDSKGVTIFESEKSALCNKHSSHGMGFSPKI